MDDVWFEGGVFKRIQTSSGEKIVEYYDPSWVYSASEGISQGTFEGSHLFNAGIDRDNCEDLVSGKLGATNFSFSEVHAEYESTTTDSDGNRSTTWHIIFVKKNWFTSKT